MSQNPVLKIENTGKVEGDKVWFRPFHFQLNQSEVAAIQCDHIVGRVLFNVLTGEEAGSGRMSYFDQSHPSEWKRYSHRIGWVSHEEGVYERLTPYEYLRFFQQLYGRKGDINELLHKVNLSSRKSQRIKHLNYSERKRLSFVKALVHKPELVILEEPDQNIDLESKVILRELINEHTAEGGAALVITSNMESAVILTNDVYRLNEEGLKTMDVQEPDEALARDKHDVQEAEGLPETEASAHVQVERIPAKVKEKMILFDPTEIDYVESVDGTVQLHVKGGVFPCTITLQDLTERLEPFGFFRCHRSYIVNLQKVREVMTWTRNSYSLILDDHHKSNIPLSKGKLQDLKQVLRM
ncbi:LytTR family transcriptional regulator DNA-binding domain-containing protein [Halobacillus sp. A5]|uniref:LytTR family transcriptional regulator DNA-binding domain-containing protein n=1 Tax=Halobacillus sp. A5 TaxID=2880263 RepID=UPI0020A61F3A|nr:LytTR family transcriptional regulator DNA-binding domain-containing protein [Halobacillus sp. A5]MCP3027030.1 LytTR family transcriptional regulator DNA-binding domain-containing protein [Halobacillus sp. A5]